jgi:hypothetical protein
VGAVTVVTVVAGTEVVVVVVDGLVVGAVLGDDFDEQAAASRTMAAASVCPHRPAVGRRRGDGTFPEMSRAVALAAAGFVVTALVAACRTTPGASVAGRSPGREGVGAPASEAATTTTTTLPADGFTPIAVGSDLTQLVTPLGTVLRVDPRRLSVAVIPGTMEPGGTFPEGGQVPPSLRPVLVAATNAGFKRADARGGEYVDGRLTGTLRAGAATFVIRADGRFDVGAWQQSVAPAPGDVAVLQNLEPLVDQGQPAPDLGADILARWGLTFRPALPVSVWRSGLGIDRFGRLLYAVGTNAVPAQLAALLISAGAIRAMELDINHLWVFASAFSHPDPAHPDVVTAAALLPGMTPAAGHVLLPGARDFLAIYRRLPTP